MSSIIIFWLLGPSKGSQELFNNLFQLFIIFYGNFVSVKFAGFIAAMIVAIFRLFGKCFLGNLSLCREY